MLFYAMTSAGLEDALVQEFEEIGLKNIKKSFLGVYFEGDMQDCMKANGKAMGTMVPMIKGEAPYDAAAVKAALSTTEAACAKWAEFWPADSATSKTLKTRALPAIWTDPKGFEAAGGIEYKAFTELATTDEAGFKAKFPALGAACGGCHEKFRAPAP